MWDRSLFVVGVLLLVIGLAIMGGTILALIEHAVTSIWGDDD